MRRVVWLVAVLVLGLSGCRQAETPPVVYPTITQTWSLAPEDWATDGIRWWAPGTDADPNRYRQIEVTLTAPADGQLSYLFTNTTITASGVETLSGVGADVIGLHDRVAAPFPRLSGLTARSAAPSASAVLAPLVVGQSTWAFIDAFWATSRDAQPTSANAHPSTLRSLTSAGSRTLAVWVADDCWVATPATGSPAHLVTQPMVDALAGRFLTDGIHDIYGWVTGLYGPEWTDAGPGPTYQGVPLIDGGGTVHIVLANLNSSGTAQGLLLGYFHALNNVPTWVHPGSNARVMFALDADSLANPSPDGVTSGSAWSLGAYRPSQVVSTLAHEFQHMVQFYQKQVVHDVVAETDTWVNEMASMVTEDLVSANLGTPGPRGVSGTDPTAGPFSNTRGRLPGFNASHDAVALTGWANSRTTYPVLDSYSSAYAFGAWLVRNFGGPSLVRTLVRSPFTDAGAVVAAVNAVNGTSVTYASLVRQWGLAVALQASSAPGVAYSAPGGGSFQWSGSPFTLGSIDLSRYPSGSGFGPRVRTGTLDASVSPGATVIYRAGSISAGQPLGRTLTVPPNVALTLVVGP